jgi:hypothetical protein
MTLLINFALSMVLISSFLPRVVEQKNHTLVEMARMMLDEHTTSRRFWADAISTACYIAHRIFMHSILHLTPFELRFGHKPSISHLRPFGCKCFVLKCGILLMAFYLDTPLMVDLTECLTLRPLMSVLLVLMMCLSVQVTRKWRIASL